MKKNFIKYIAMVLIAASAFTMLSACNTTGSGDSTSGTENTPETPESSAPATDAPTSESESETEAGPKEYTVDVKWNFGYVGSSTNTTTTNKLNMSGSMYSYTDIINLGPAGTTVTFTDDNTNSNNDANFASAAAYVFSSWKLENGVWTIDLEGYNANGTDAKFTDANGARTYTYTTTKDNECLRLCYRSGQSASFTPASFPKVTVTSTAEPKVEEEKEPEVTDSTGTVVNVKWNKGYVGSSTNPYGYANKLNAGGGSYAYTDVIELAKKGTKVTFTDKANGATSNNAYVVSSWKKDGSNWVLDLDKINIPGASSLVVSSTSAGTVYTYVSTYDNECIRFCYRSENATTFPEIYMSETSEPGTTEDMIKAEEERLNWIEEDKKRAFYEILKGKKFTVIGDSYFAGDGIEKQNVWTSLLADKYDMEYYNYGIGGSTISNFVTTNNPMVSRYTNMVNNDPDIVIIEGGRNDYNKSVPIGTLQDTQTTTMMGAVRYLITNIQKKYPNAVIICLTCWEVGGNKNSAGNYCSDYGKAMIDVCKDMNVLCINAMDQEATGVYMTDSSFRAQYCIGPNDISHLNEEGMKLVLPKFEKMIADLYTSAKAQ